MLLFFILIRTPYEHIIPLVCSFCNFFMLIALTDFFLCTKILL